MSSIGDRYGGSGEFIQHLDQLIGAQELIIGEMGSVSIEKIENDDRLLQQMCDLTQLFAITIEYIDSAEVREGSINNKSFNNIKERIDLLKGKLTDNPQLLNNIKLISHSLLKHEPIDSKIIESTSKPPQGVGKRVKRDFDADYPSASPPASPRSEMSSPMRSDSDSESYSDEVAETLSDFSYGVADSDVEESSFDTPFLNSPPRSNWKPVSRVEINKLDSTVGLPPPIENSLNVADIINVQEEVDTHPVHSEAHLISQGQVNHLKEKYKGNLPEEDRSESLSDRVAILINADSDTWSADEISATIVEARNYLHSCEKRNKISPDYEKIKNGTKILDLLCRSAKSRECVEGKYDHRNSKGDLLADEGKKNPIGWTGSSNNRQITGETPKGLQGDKAHDGYAKQAAQVPVTLVNARRQEAKIPVEGSSATAATDTIERLGVIADTSNAYTDLGEMKRAAGDENLRKEKLVELQKMKKKCKSERQIATIEYALREFETSKSLLRAIDQRETNLSVQMMQHLMHQFQNAEGKIGENFKMMHVLLLTETTKGWDEGNSWYKDEGHFIGDMGQIFSDFQGAKVRFEERLTAPYIETMEDGKKILHFPKDNENYPDETTLETSFVNVGVQAMKDDRTMQTEFFKSWYSEMKTAIEDKDSTPNRKDAELKNLEKIKESFLSNEDEGKKTDLEVALEMVVLGKKLGFSMSSGCMSAKDRTGVLCEAAVIAFAKEHYVKEAALESIKNSPLEKYKKAFRKIESIKESIQLEEINKKGESEERLKKIQAKIDRYNIKIRKIENAIEPYLMVCEAQAAKDFDELIEKNSAIINEFILYQTALKIANENCDYSGLKPQTAVKTMTSVLPFVSAMGTAGQIARAAKDAI